METHEAPQSLWNLIVDQVSGAELQEIRGCLGDALIDMYTEMLAEVEVWQHIWREVKQGGPSRPQTPCPPLPDPPAVRELLRAQVQLLLLSVREKITREGGDGDAAVSRYTPAVVSYALATPGNRSDGLGFPCRSAPRPCQTGERSSPGPLLSSSSQGEIKAMSSQPGPLLRSSSQGEIEAVSSQPGPLLSSSSQGEIEAVSSQPGPLLSSSSQGEIEAMSSQLNVSSIDQVVAHLQCVLTRECERLQIRVQTLQERVVQEHGTRMAAVTPVPTVTELREERRVLQMDLQHPCLLTSWPPSPQDPGPPCSSRLSGTRVLCAADRKSQSPLTSTVTSGPASPPHIRPHPPLAPPRTEAPPSRRTRTQSASSSSSSSPSARNLSPLQALDPQTSLAPEVTRSPHRTPVCPGAAVHLGEVVSPPGVSPTTLDQNRQPPASPHRIASKGRQTTTRSSSRQPPDHHGTDGRIPESSLVNGSPDQDSETGFSPTVRTRMPCPPGSLRIPRQAGVLTQPRSSRGAAGSPGSYLPPLLPSGCLMTECVPFHPSPPAVHRPPSRGQSVSRRLCVPQGDSLVSPT